MGAFHMSYWQRPLKEIEVNLQIIGSQNRKPDGPCHLAVWSYINDVQISLHGLRQALEQIDEEIAASQRHPIAGS